MERGLQQAGRYGILFMVLSFLGWAAETLFFFLPLKNWVFALPVPWVRTLAAALILPAAVDWAVSIAQALG